MLIAILKLRVFEVNQMVLTLLHTLPTHNFFEVFNALMLTQKLDAFAEMTNGLFLQAVPALIDDKPAA